ncbi:MAG TPA: SGNH hydrolase domain-containing protein [Acidimicrobiales bacterium]
MRPRPLHLRPGIGQGGAGHAGCEDWRGLWPWLAAAEHPQVVALGVGRWEVLDHYWDGHWVHIGERVWDAHVAADLRSAVGIFHTFGARVVLLTMPYVDPAGRQPDGLPWSEDSPARARAFNALVERVARADPGEVSVVDVNRMLSPDGVYTASLAGVVVRWSDGIHVTPAGGQLLQPEILPDIARLGLRDERGSRVHA